MIVFVSCQLGGSSGLHSSISKEPFGSGGVPGRISPPWLSNWPFALQRPQSNKKFGISDERSVKSDRRTSVTD
jgi:hypothetical protein